MNNFSEWFNDTIRRATQTPRTILRNIGRVIKWIPVIWKDRDWDEHYLVIILQFKLTQMAMLHMKRGVTVDRYNTAQEILHAVHLLERTKMEDLYHEFDLVKEAELQAERREEAFNYIAKNMNNWWD